MLIMLRREGESILIGEDVEIRILAIGGSRVKVGIAAPRSIPVVAREVQLVRAENIAAAGVSSSAAIALAARLSRQITPDQNPRAIGMSDKTK
jgi:carbon storage regulator